MRIFIEQCFRGHDETRRAKAALGCTVLDKFLLNRMQSAVRAGNTFDGNDVGIVRALHQHEARAHGFAILDNHATAAMPGRATILDAGETQLVAQNVHQFGFGRGSDFNFFSIHR